MTRLPILFLTVFLSVNNVNAQESIYDSLVSITCMDKELNSPIEGVYIYLDDTFLGITNENGRFYIPSIAFVNENLLTFKHPFYEGFSKKIVNNNSCVVELKSNAKILESVDIVFFDRKKMLKRHKKKRWPEYVGIYKYVETVYNEQNEVVYLKEMIVYIKDEGGNQDGFLLKPAEDVEIIAKRELIKKQDSTFYILNNNNTHESLIQKIRADNYYRKSRGFFNKSKIDKFKTQNFKNGDTLSIYFSQKDTVYGVSNFVYGNGVYNSINDTVINFKVLLPYNNLSEKSKELKIYRAKKFNEFLEYNKMEAIEVAYKRHKKHPIPEKYTYIQNYLLINKEDFQFNKFKREVHIDLLEVLDVKTEIKAEKVNMLGLFSSEINVDGNHELFDENIENINE